MYQIRRPLTKFGNKRAEFMGAKYHSKGEAGYAGELQTLKLAGEIVDWQRQFKIDLQVNGKHVTNYYMDFVVELPDGSIELREYKGYETGEWKMKWRLLEVTLEEVTERYWPGKEVNIVIVKHVSKGFFRKGKKA